jgi:hypothetical protein
MVEDLSKPKEGSQPIHFDSLYAKGLLAQFKVLLWRNNHVYWRWAALSTGTCPCSPEQLQHTATVQHSTALQCAVVQCSASEPAVKQMTALQAVVHKWCKYRSMLGGRVHGIIDALQEPAVQQRAAGLHHDHRPVLWRLLLGGELSDCYWQCSTTCSSMHATSWASTNVSC